MQRNVPIPIGALQVEAGNSGKIGYRLTYTGTIKIVAFVSGAWRYITPAESGAYGEVNGAAQDKLVYFAGDITSALFEYDAEVIISNDNVSTLSIPQACEYITLYQSDALTSVLYTDGVCNVKRVHGHAWTTTQRDILIQIIQDSTVSDGKLYIGKYDTYKDAVATVATAKGWQTILVIGQ